MRLLAVRHGETDANANKLLQGSRLDQSLNELGLQQAREIGELLWTEQVNVLYCSQLKRAHETAEIIATKLSLEINITELLSEKDFGALTNKSWGQIHKELGSQEIRAIDRAHTYDYRVYGGESVDQVKERIEKFLNHIRSEHSNQTVLAVTHSGIVRLLHHILEIEMPDRIANASLHRFDL